MSTTQYAYWRTDKPKEEGYSHELISNQFKNFSSPQNSPDTLNTWPENGARTMIQALEKNA